MIRNIFLFFLFFILFNACSSMTAVYKADYDFSKIKNVYIQDSQSSAQTQIIKDSIIKQLMSKGYNIKSKSDNADVVIYYTITEYQPSKKYLIRNNQTNVTDTTSNVNINLYNNETLEIGGSSVYDLGTAYGINNSRIIASNATVGVSLTIKDVVSDDIVWTNSYTYEGMDLLSAVNGVVRYILKSFPPEKNN